MNTKRTKKIDGVKYMCENNPTYIKGEGGYTASAKKYRVYYYNETKKALMLKGFCDTIEDFRNGMIKIG